MTREDTEPAGSIMGRWARVSGDSQSEADQIPDIDDYCDDRDYVKGKVYEVHGKSAYKGAQDPDWRKVVRDIQDGVIHGVVCWMVDRLDRRNILHAIPMVLAVLDAGGRIEFSEQPECNLDANSPAIDEQIKAFSDRIHAANQESKIKSKRIIKAHRRRRDSGSVIGRAAWGFEIICDECHRPPARPGCKDHIKIFAPTGLGRTWIPRIYAKAVDKWSGSQIAEWLDSEGVPTTGGKPWNEAFVVRLISNPIYYGKRRNAGNLKTEALVSATTWQEANDAMSSRSSRKSRVTKGHKKAMLAPVCGACYGESRPGCTKGISPMYRIFAGYGAARRPYYRCSGHQPQRKGCGAPMILLSELDSAVDEALAARGGMHFEREFIAGDDRSAAIARFREDGVDAMRKGDYEAATVAMKEAERLEDLPRIKPHWEPVETKMTEAEYYASLEGEAKRLYIAQRQILAHTDEDGGIIVVITEKDFGDRP
jgi:DNA invertase Pin-like site-specific DNA recombinase